MMSEAGLHSFELSEIRTNHVGFGILSRLSQKIIESPGIINVDMRNLSWIDGNMCAALGAVLGQRNAQVQFMEGYGPGVDIMRKNGFYRRFGFERTMDFYSTTIEFTHFKDLSTGSDQFTDYVGKHFRHQEKGLPTMSLALLRRFREALFEIFENALEHSYTERGVFACGQYYPHKNRLDFSIADVGIGIARNVLRNMSLNMTDQEAIHWALGGNTSRRGNRPGGLGLKLIQEFVKLNGGRLVVVSNTAYYEKGSAGVEERTLPYTFPGTVMTIELNTEDTQSYCLQSEINENELF